MTAEFDEFRMGNLHGLRSAKSFHKSWPSLRAAIELRLSESPTGEEIYALGDQLSNIFRSVRPDATVVDGVEIQNIAWERSQKDVSSGGSTWECLVVWYLNLVLYGTDVIAVKRKKSNSPTVLTDAISVTLGGHSTTTEADVLVYSVPSLGTIAGTRLSVEILNKLIAAQASDCVLAVIQCKTNWNDNAQIPMLWDMIYQASSSSASGNVKVGRNGVSPRAFRNKSIKYAFMTVPTNTRDVKLQKSVAVTRVVNLSGGNYWGHPTESGVASGFSEFAVRNFSEFFSGSVQNHIDSQLAANPKLIDRFLSLDFEAISSLPRPSASQKTKQALESSSPKLF